MLIFGSSGSDWEEKARYAEDKADNEFAKVREVRCEGIEDVQTALATIAAFAADTKCKKFLYHATINLNPGERLTLEQWREAVDRLEEKLNLTGHHRVVFEHIKKDRQHYHIYWSRLPPNGGAAATMSNDYVAHQKTAKELEKKFGLKPAPRKAKGKPSKKKREINDRNGGIRIEPDIVAKEVTRIYRESQTTQAFLQNLTKAGYVLTHGKNGSYVLVDKQGGYHGLLRRIKGAKLADVEKKFPDLKKAPLPSLNAVLRSRRGTSKSGFRRTAKTAKRPRPRVSKVRRSTKIPRGWKLGGSLAAAKRQRFSGERKQYPLPLMRRKSTGAVTKTSTSGVASAKTQKPIKTGKGKSTTGTIQNGSRRSPATVSETSKGQNYRHAASHGGSSTTISPPFHDASPIMAWFRRVALGAKHRQEQEPQFMPTRPVAHGGMCEAQRIDLAAAIAGKITWAEYFKKWGGNGPSL